MSFHNGTDMKNCCPNFQLSESAILLFLYLIYEHFVHTLYTLWYIIRYIIILTCL